MAKIGAREQKLRDMRSKLPRASAPVKPKEKKTMDTNLNGVSDLPDEVPVMFRREPNPVMPAPTIAAEKPAKTEKPKPAKKPTAPKPAGKAKGAKKAKGAPKVAATGKKSASKPAKAKMAGSKTDLIAGMLQRKSGCTTKEVLAATGWPTVSMPAMAKSAGLKLRKEKDGSVTRYFAA